MKTKILFCLFFTSCFNTLSFGQGFKLHFSSGYHFPFSKSAIFLSDSSNGTVNQTSYYKDTIMFTNKLQSVKGSLGSGLGITIGFEYDFNKYFGLGLDYSYLSGSKISTEYKYNYSGTYVSDFIDDKMTLSSKTMYLMPTIYMMYPVGKFCIYSSIGASLPISAKLFIESDVTDVTDETTPYKTTTNQSTWKGEIDTKFAMGFTSKIGCSVEIMKYLNVFVECKNLNQVVFTKSGKMTGYTENGVDKLYTIPANEQTIEYTDEYDAATNNPLNPKALSQSIPLHSLGVNLGITIKF